MCRTLNNWRGAPRAQKKRNRTVPKKGRAFTRWKENKNVGTEPFFIGSVPKGVHSRLWTFLGTERIKLEWVKYRLHVKFCRSRSSFCPSRSNFFGRVNGPFVAEFCLGLFQKPWTKTLTKKGLQKLSRKQQKSCLATCSRSDVSTDLRGKSFTFTCY